MAKSDHPTARELATADPVLSKSELLGERLKQELTLPGVTIGSRFHSIQDIRERYGVSLSTAHKVVSILVRAGYLTSKRGQGFFVQTRPKHHDLHPMLRAVPRTRKILLAMVQTTAAARVIRGLHAACAETSYRVEVVDLLSPNFLELANEEGVAGIVLTPTAEPTHLRHVQKPKICVGRWLHREDNVVSYIANAEQASIEVVKYCCGLRHERIAIALGQDDTHGPDELFASQLIAGMRRGFQTYGLTWDDDLVCVSLSKSAREVAASFAESFQGSGITAVFAPLWPTFASIYFELLRKGLAIPRSLSMIAYGQHTLSECISPTPTRFELFIEQISRKAAETLIQHALGLGEIPPERVETFPVQLLLGETCVMNPKFAQ